MMDAAALWASRWVRRDDAHAPVARLLGPNLSTIIGMHKERREGAVEKG